MLAQDILVLVITYYNKKCFITLINWKNSFYFLITFLTLFFFRNDKY